MRMDGPILRYNNDSVKARSGEASGGLVHVDWDNGDMRIGGARFPLAPLSMFTPELDGTIATQGDRLVIAIQNQWYTPNVVTLNTSANPTEGQLASYTIQHGDDSRVLTNATAMETNMVHQKNKEIRITGVNYSTGAIEMITKTAPPGQGYAISSLSESTTEGELTTVGGELISGGELKTVCVRTEFDFDGAPITYTGQQTLEILGISLSVSFDPGASQQVKDAYFQRLYTNYLMGVENEHNSAITVTAVEFDQYFQRLVTSPKRLATITDSYINESEFNALPLVTPGVVFTAHKTSPSSVIVYLNEFNNGDEVMRNGNVYFPIEEGKQYIANWEMAKLLPTVEIGPPVANATTGKVGHSFVIRHFATVALRIIGPLETYCADNQVIDTRYSYTTPIITTDTRRDIHTITVYASPLN